MNNSEPILGGFILFARKILHSLIMSKPHLWFKLFVWMILQASHKDHGKLKRGQFFTTIERMRDAMTYKVGYRTVKPSVREIRDAYEGLTKGTMIDTTKVTHGMLITILNYDYYQNPENYEGHNEGHDESTTNRHNINKNGNKNGYIADSRISTLISFFSEQCLSLKGFKPGINGADGKAIQRALKDMTEPEVREAVLFYLRSPKADDCGVTLTACLSKHSLNVWKQNRRKNDWQTIA